MGFLGVTAGVGAVTYSTGTAVFCWEKGRSSWYAVVSGIPDFPEADIKAYLWDGQLDSLGPCIVRNRSADVRHPAQQTLSLNVLALTREKVFAYWIEEQGAVWMKRLWGR